MAARSTWKPEDEARFMQICHAHQTIGVNGLICIRADAWREIARLMERTVRACQDRFWSRNAAAGKKKYYRPRIAARGICNDAIDLQRPYDLPSPKTITALIFGDPLPGRSALDRKRGVGAP